MKLLEQVRQTLRVKHYSLATERCYCQWLQRFIFFHGVKHPNSMGAEEGERFPRAQAPPELAGYGGSAAHRSRRWRAGSGSIPACAAQNAQTETLPHRNHS